MQQYRDVVLSPLGRPIPGATITVTLAAGGAATIYSDNGTTVLGSNVLTSDSNGEYVFYAASGRYTLTIAASGYTTTTRDVVLWDQSNIQMQSDYGGMVADGTDQTSAFTTWLGTLSASAGGVYTIPYNLRFRYETVAAAAPVGLVFFDLSALNNYAGVGDTSKRVGVFDSGDGGNDLAWHVTSGHNAIFQTNNLATSGTTSAAERIQGHVYSAGMYALGNKGYREMAEYLVKRSTGNAWWEWNWTCVAPWSAIGASYERWAAGVAATSGVTYVVSNARVYVAASTATTGATAPTHSTGTVSDGAVDWTFVRTFGSTVLALDEYGRLRSNGGAANTDLLSLVQRDDDPATSCVVTMQAKKTAGTSRFAQLVLNPTDGATPSVVEAQPVIRATAGTGLQVLKSDASAALATFTDAGGAEFNSLKLGGVTVTSGTTVDVGSKTIVYLDYPSPATITGFTNAPANKPFQIVFVSANITITHNASTLVCQGSTSIVTPAAWSSSWFLQVDPAVSNRVIETGRSFK